MFARCNWIWAVVRLHATNSVAPSKQFNGKLLFMPQFLVLIISCLNDVTTSEQNDAEFTDSSLTVDSPVL